MVSEIKIEHVSLHDVVSLVAYSDLVVESGNHIEISINNNYPDEKLKITVNIGSGKFLESNCKDDLNAVFYVEDLNDIKSIDEKNIEELKKVLEKIEELTGYPVKKEFELRDCTSGVLLEEFHDIDFDDDNDNDDCDCDLRKYLINAIDTAEEIIIKRKSEK